FSSRRRHTRSKRDWSSDVCSSDLSRSAGVQEGESDLVRQPYGSAQFEAVRDLEVRRPQASTFQGTIEGRVLQVGPRLEVGEGHEIGRASCRERGEVTVGEEGEKDR